MEQLLTLRELADVVRYSVRTIENWAYGRAPAPPNFPKPFRMGRDLRWRASDVTAYIDSLVDCETSFTCRSQPWGGHLAPKSKAKAAASQAPKHAQKRQGGRERKYEPWNPATAGA